MSAESIIADIQAAFDGISREDGTTLHEAEEIDCRGSPEELQRARLLDTDTRWQDVPDEWIGSFPSAFNFMDPKGLRYYLPAVMIWHFRHPHWSEPASADIVRSLLMDSRFAYRRLVELFDLLTDAQRQATARWLALYVQDTADWETCLKETIWAKYLDA